MGPATIVSCFSPAIGGRFRGLGRAGTRGEGKPTGLAFFRALFLFVSARACVLMCDVWRVYRSEKREGGGVFWCVTIRSREERGFFFYRGKLSLYAIENENPDAEPATLAASLAEEDGASKGSSTTATAWRARTGATGGARPRPAEDDDQER
jgi:hypothetical protein